MSSLVEASQRHPNDEERAYYAFQRWAWRLFAPFYDAAVYLPLRDLRGEVAAAVKLSPGSRLLDVATGTGAQAFAFAKVAREVLGVDLSPAMLTIARRKNPYANVAFREADAASLPFEDESFDASCVSFALHEMPAGIRRRVVGEMARVTQAGGSVVVVDYALPSRPALHWLGYHFIRLYEGKHFATLATTDLADLLAAAGVDVIERRSLLAGFAQLLIGRRR